MRRKILFTLAGLFFACIFSVFFKACFFENAERDRIVFVDSFEYVQRNVLALDSLIELANKNCEADYAIDFQSDNIIMMNHKIEDDRLKAGYFCPLAKITPREFYRITDVLKRNGITSVYTDYATRVKVFGYKEYYNEFVMLREIIIDEKDNRERMMQSRHNSLDRKGKLVLIHPI